MSTVKLGKDSIKNEEAVILELDNMITNLLDLRKVLRHYDVQAAESGISVPQYLAATRNALTRFCAADMSIEYPSLTSVIANGVTGMSVTWRLHDAIGKLKQAVAKMEAVRCLIRSDEEADKLTPYIDGALGNICIYTIEQFHMHDSDVPPDISLFKHLSKKSISMDVWYGTLLDILGSTGVEPYGYEQMSIYFDVMPTILPVGLLSEMEDAKFPLTPALCQSIVEGKVTSEEAADLFGEYQQETVEETLSSKITPATIMTKLKLEE